MIDRRVDISQSGKIWIVLAGFGIGLYLLWQLGNSIASGSLMVAAMLGAAFAALFVAAKIARDWRTGVYYFFIWLLIEDLVRKYSGNNMMVYFAKDVLVAVTYASFVVARMRERIKPFHPPFRFALGAFVILGFVQVFNPLSPSIFYGLLGLKLYFYYIPLMFVGYALFQEERDLPKFFVVNVAMAGIIASIGIIQETVGMNFLNPRGGEDIDLLSHMVRYTHSGLELSRAPSIFVSEGRFGVYMFVAFIIAAAGAGYLLLQSKRPGRNIVFPGLGLVALGGIMTGSRGAVVYLSATALFLSAGMLWGAPLGKAAGYRLIKAIRRGFTFIAVAVWLAAILLPGVMVPRLVFYQESLMPNSEYSEVANRSWAYPVGQLKVALSDPDWAIGHGIGTVSLGVQYVKRIMDAPQNVLGVENGFGELIVELGILGPILWLLWSGSLLFSGFKTLIRLKGTWAFPIALSIMWFAFLLLLPFTWGGLVQYQNFVTNAYFWLFVGILFRLPDLVKQDDLKVAPAPIP